VLYEFEFARKGIWCLVIKLMSTFTSING